MATDGAQDRDAGGKGEGANAMWGGRFDAAPDAVMTAINASIRFDRRLAREDVAGSRAHAAMLAAQGILSAEDAAAIDRGLAQVLEEIETGAFPFSEALEDIHMNVEARLRALIGEAAGRLQPRARATTRWRSTSGSGCARAATTPRPR